MGDQKNQPPTSEKHKVVFVGLNIKNLHEKVRILVSLLVPSQDQNHLKF